MANKIDRCPECQAVLTNPDKCVLCHWTKIEKPKKSESGPQYLGWNKRSCVRQYCQLPVTITEAGSNYCSWHYRHKDNPELYVINPSKEEWLEMRNQKSVVRIAEQWGENHLTTKHSDELRSEWIERLRDLRNKSLAIFAKKQTYTGRTE